MANITPAHHRSGRVTSPSAPAISHAPVNRMMSRGAGSQSPDEEKASELPFWRNCGRREFFQRCRRLRRQCTGQRLETDAVPCRAGHKLRAGPQPSLLRAWSFARVRPLSLAERDFLVAIVLSRCPSRAGCRKRAFHPMPICQAGTRIPCAIPQDIATMSDLSRLPLRRRLAQTHSCGIWTSSITVIIGRLMRLGRVFGRLRIETTHCACSSKA
jgi:hypothetical protein